MALCAPVLHVTSWQKAVKAVSGDDCGDEATFAVTLSVLEVVVVVSCGADWVSLGSVCGKDVS